MFEASGSVQLGDGMAASLWNDRWLPEGPLRRFAPALYLATSRPGRGRTVKEALFNHRWVQDISGAPTVQVLTEYLRTWRLVRDTALDPLRSDRYIWKWSPDAAYSVSSTYRVFFAGMTELLGAKELWRARAPPKVKLFLVGAAQQVVDVGEAQTPWSVGQRRMLSL